MVTIYFKSGHTTEVPGATSVQPDPPAVRNPFNFACLDQDGQELARFALGEILGYVITPDPRAGVSVA